MNDSAVAWCESARTVAVMALLLHRVPPSGHVHRWRAGLYAPGTQRRSTRNLLLPADVRTTLTESAPTVTDRVEGADLRRLAPVSGSGARHLKGRQL